MPELLACNQLREHTKASFPLLPGIRIGQIFQCRSNFLTRLQIQFACYKRKNTCLLKFALFELKTDKIQTLIYTTTISTKDLTDEIPLVLDFPQILDSTNKTYYFYFESPDATTSNCVSLWLTEFDEPTFLLKSAATTDSGNITFQYFCYNTQLTNSNYKSADIIICVYNQIDYVKACVKSIQEKTCYPNYQIILVDDGSSQDTKKELQKLKNVTILNTPKNLGYTGAANFGLKQSLADYRILLNSDTEVTEGWLNKLIRCGETSPKIGILGLVSNNATWQSVPSFYHTTEGWPFQEIPFPYTLDQFGFLIELLSERKYPKTSHMHGSCFAIKREVIQKIGYFDEEHYAGGYREEDDYCLRATEANFDLVYVDDAFYFHHGRKSFTSEKRAQLIREHNTYYQEKWGQKDGPNLEELKKNNPLDYLRTKLQAILKKKDKQLKNLKIGYLLNPGGRSGGVISILQNIQVLQNLGYNALLVCAKTSLESLASFPEFQLKVASYENIDEIVAQKFDILIGTHNQTIEDHLVPCLEKDPNIFPAYYIQDYEPYFYTKGTNDYLRALRSYLTIPHILGMAKTNWICNTVFERSGLKIERVLPDLNINIFKSTQSRNFNLEKRIKIIAMVRPQTPRRNPEGTLLALKEIALKYPAKVEVIIFGADNQTLEQYNFLKEPYLFPYKNLGFVSSLDLASLFNDMDIFLDASTYQAFGRTALEAMACGCVSIVPQDGGTAEYAEDGSNCLVVNSVDHNQIVTALDRLVGDLTLRQRLSQKGLETAKQFAIEKSAPSHLQLLSRFFNRQKVALLFEKTKHTKVVSHLLNRKFALNKTVNQSTSVTINQDKQTSILLNKDLIVSFATTDYLDIKKQNAIYFRPLIEVPPKKQRYFDKNITIAVIGNIEQFFITSVLVPLLSSYPHLKFRLYNSLNKLPVALQSFEKRIVQQPLENYINEAQKSVISIILNNKLSLDLDYFVQIIVAHSILCVEKDAYDLIKQRETGFVFTEGADLKQNLDLVIKDIDLQKRLTNQAYNNLLALKQSNALNRFELLLDVYFDYLTL